MWWITPGIVGHSFVSWFVPFLISCMFFGPDGSLMVDIKIFKSAMFASGSMCGALLLDRQLRRLARIGLPAGETYTSAALQIGCLFAFANTVLDLALLLPLINTMNAGKPDFEPMTAVSWFLEIGLCYLAIPAEAWLAGRLADSAAATAASAAASSAKKR